MQTVKSLQLITLLAQGTDKILMVTFRFKPHYIRQTLPKSPPGISLAATTAARASLPVSSQKAAGSGQYASAAACAIAST
ncbi:MAG: hypothetical protein EA408_00175 [Marinilabiliales bacterium]|nr:MAG: hypothetical protein EA394_00020 [Bacteroidia bacterium]TVR75551.1 MAG: hypothetical protein EA408_00175 [Marinilabiliales bacterium]